MTLTIEERMFRLEHVTTVMTRLQAIGLTFFGCSKTVYRYTTRTIEQLHAEIIEYVRKMSEDHLIEVFRNKVKRYQL